MKELLLQLLERLEPRLAVLLVEAHERHIRPKRHRRLY